MKQKRAIVSKFNEDRCNNSGAGRYGLSRAQVIYYMNVKTQLTSYMIKCNVALILLLSVSFINVPQACDVPASEKGIFVADFEYIADSLTSDSGVDDSVGITDEVVEKIGAVHNVSLVQVKATFYLEHSYLWPLTRAPPKSMI